MTIRWKIALVEDDRRLAREVSAGLGEEGYTVRSASSADGGLQLVRQWNPDVVLLDPMLPDNEGPGLFKVFRAETDAALVGISANSSVSDRVAGLKMGADDYVAKPFALEELMGPHFAHTSEAGGRWRATVGAHRAWNRIPVHPRGLMATGVSLSRCRGHSTE